MNGNLSFHNAADARWFFVIVWAPPSDSRKNSLAKIGPETNTLFPVRTDGKIGVRDKPGRNWEEEL